MRDAFTSCRHERETEDGAALRALTATTGLHGPPEVEFIQRLPPDLTVAGATHGVCAPPHSCAFFAAVVRQSQLHALRGASQPERGRFCVSNASQLHSLSLPPPVLRGPERGTTAGTAAVRGGEFVALPALDAGEAVSPYTRAGLSVLRGFLDPWVRTAGSSGACDVAARLAATLPAGGVKASS